LKSECNHTFTHGAIGDQMVANVADTTEVARWLHTVTSAIRGWAWCSNAAWSTFIYICTQQTSASHSISVINATYHTALCLALQSYITESMY